jgi:disulfide bond formation protein DsbB
MEMQASAAQRRNARLLGAALMMLSALVGVLAASDLMSLRAGIAARQSPLIVRDAPAVMVPCVLAMGCVALLLLLLPDRKWQKRLFGAALASLSLLLVLPFALPSAVERVLHANGYRSCGKGDPSSRLPSDTWVRGGDAACLPSSRKSGASSRR